MLVPGGTRGGNLLSGRVAAPTAEESITLRRERQKTRIVAGVVDAKVSVRCITQLAEQVAVVVEHARPVIGTLGARDERVVLAVNVYGVGHAALNGRTARIMLT